MLPGLYRWETSWGRLWRKLFPNCFKSVKQQICRLTDMGTELLNNSSSLQKLLQETAPKQKLGLTAVDLRRGIRRRWSSVEKTVVTTSNIMALNEIIKQKLWNHGARTGIELNLPASTHQQWLSTQEWSSNDIEKRNLIMIMICKMLHSSSQPNMDFKQD